MRLDTFNPSNVPFDDLTARQEQDMWFALIDDMDTLYGTYLPDTDGDDPIHDAHARLTDQIMSYGPANADEAKAIIAITNHDMEAFELTDDHLRARYRAFALLDIIASGNKGS